RRRHTRSDRDWSSDVCSSDLWPANTVVARRAVFLAFDGEEEKARSLLARALETFPHQVNATILILEQARTADPRPVEPLLVMARAFSGSRKRSEERRVGKSVDVGRRRISETI